MNTTKTASELVIDYQGGYEMRVEGTANGVRYIASKPARVFYMGKLRHTGTRQECEEWLEGKGIAVQGVR